MELLKSSSTHPVCIYTEHPDLDMDVRRYPNLLNSLRPNDAYMRR